MNPRCRKLLLLTVTATTPPSRNSVVNLVPETIMEAPPAETTRPARCRSL